MSHLKSLIKQQVVNAAHPDDSVFQAAQLMSAKRIGCLVVLAENELIGIVTERDLMTKVITHSLDPKTTKLRDIMTQSVVTVTPTTTVDECFNLMKKIGCRHLPLIENGKVLAVVSIRNVLSWTLEQLRFERDQLEQYIQS